MSNSVGVGSDGAINQYTDVMINMKADVMNPCETNYDDSKVAVISYICTIDKTSIYAKQAIYVKRVFKKTGILRSEELPVLFLHRGVRIFGEMVNLIIGSR